MNSQIKQPPTHFNSVRVIDPTIKNNYIKFKEKILQDGPIVGLDKKMFVEPERLHLTLNVMYLKDDVDLATAVQLLNECRETIVMPIKEKYESITISIRGIDIMNDDPSRVRYLYAIIESEAMQCVGDAILKRFIDAGLTKREINRDTVKLHMTLINAKRFDARQILDKYGQYEFGSQELHEIHIAIMRSTDTDGFYKCTTSISF